MNYSPIQNLREVIIGEDRHFCIRAVCHGFELWIDTHAQPFHLYTEKEYAKWMEAKEGAP